MTESVLPEAAQRFIDATNAEDRAALLAAFSSGGRVDDFGRIFAGPEAIGGWSDNENIGTHNRITVSRVVDHGDYVLAAIVVSGNGYNGSGTFEFHLRDELIERLIIRG